MLANLRRATRPGGHIYITVEEIDEAGVDAALVDARARRWPAVRGEVIDGDTGGYHYYPGRGRVMGWLKAGGFQVDEAYD